MIDSRSKRFLGLITVGGLILAPGRCWGADTVSYSRDIQAIFAQKCFDCHGPDKSESGLRLDRRVDAIKPADSGETAIVPGDTDASELFRRIVSDDPDLRMPPENEPLADDDVAAIRRWIASGANYDAHWAYRPLAYPPPPIVERTDWIRNDLDRFVASKLESAGIEPSGSANRYTLIKRLAYDLHGIPPTTEAVDAFVNDASPNAYERLVDDMLASVRFAERWARHWLDKARYADSDGYEKDNNRPDAWRYRDWVIEAIHNDMPFDQFTTEQLAGDLLPDGTEQQVLATAFNRQTLTNTEGGTDREQWRVAAVMDRTETVGAVWLGLTIGCARCHNHKYDQITQKEYYELYAYFDNADETNADVPTSTAPKSPRMSARVLAERQQDRRQTHILRRGEFKQKLDPVANGTLATLTTAARDPGDRLEFARWLVDGNNPIVPRVAVNQIWDHLFGYGLVRTLNDFGVRGDPPTHVELLDWLASEYLRLGWSRKQLIKTIVMSATYRQSSHHRADVAAIDPSNRLLSRQNRFRLEAEAIRDSFLAVAGLLSDKVGGPSVYPPIPSGITDLNYNSSFKWTTSPGEDRYRRGMYTYFKRTAPHPNLTTLDCPDSNVTCVKRDRSNTPLAALITLNNAVFHEAAQAFARDVLATRLATDEERLTMAWRRCIARPADEQEIATLVHLLEQSRKWFADHADDAERLVGGYVVDGIPAEESAAWITTLRMVLNLDEFITRE